MTRPIGARSATGRRHGGLRWLPWVLLLVLAVVIAAVVLIVLNIGDDDAAGTEPGQRATAAVEFVSAA